MRSSSVIAQPCWTTSDTGGQDSSLDESSIIDWWYYGEVMEGLIGVIASSRGNLNASFGEISIVHFARSYMQPALSNCNFLCSFEKLRDRLSAVGAFWLSSMVLVGCYYCDCCCGGDGGVAIR